MGYKVVLLVLGAGVLLGCTSQSGPPFVAIRDIRDGMGIVYAYQKGGGSAPSAHVRLHKHGSFAIKENGYTYWEIPAGTHRIQMQWAVSYGAMEQNPALKRVTRRKFRVKPGKSHYYRLEVTSSGAFKDLEWAFAPVREDVALAELALCKRSDKRVRARTIR